MEGLVENDHQRRVVFDVMIFMLRGKFLSFNMFSRESSIDGVREDRAININVGPKTY